MFHRSLSQLVFILLGGQPLTKIDRGLLEEIKQDQVAALAP